MAYVSKEVVKNAREALKVVNKKYNMKTSLRVDNHTALHCTIISGSIDFGFTSGDINHYWIDTDTRLSPIAKEYLEEVNKVLHAEHWDKSDIQSDYFHCAFYVYIRVGRWDKHYILSSKDAGQEE